MIVVDVNVIAYLLIDGTHTAAAEGVLAVDAEWAVPLLWRSEWRNVLAGYLRRGEMDRARVMENVRAAESLVRDREHLVESGRVIELVADSTCSAYDCEYVALADALEVRLVTADRRIISDFPNVALSPESFIAASAR